MPEHLLKVACIRQSENLTDDLGGSNLILYWTTARRPNYYTMTPSEKFENYARNELIKNLVL